MLASSITGLVAARPQVSRQQTTKSPITIFTTTTHIDPDPQFRNRTWEINVDESPVLTERVYGFKERKEDERIRQAILGRPPDDEMCLLKRGRERSNEASASPFQDDHDEREDCRQQQERWELWYCV